jgi:pilus assembly protein CpaB
MLKLSPKTLLILAIVLSLITGGLVYDYLQKAAKSDAVTLETVVVAVKDIPGRTVITKDMIKVAKVPPDLVQAGSIRDETKVIGIMTRVPINAGDQITERRLALEGKAAGFVGAIPRDKRAFTIAASDITGVAGFIKAGDYVDIVATFDKSVAGESLSSLMLQNVLVLAANQNDNMESTAKKDTERMVSITLAVSPDEASALALASEKGKVHFALRPFQPSVGYSSNQAVTPRDILASYMRPESSAPVVISTPTPAPASPGIKVIKGTKVETVAVY